MKPLNKQTQSNKPVKIFESKPIPQLKPIRVLGNGAFGYVFEAFDMNLGCKVALKRS